MIHTPFFALLGAALCAQLATAIQPLVVKGADIVIESTGERFQIVGVAYQPGGSSGYKPDSGVDVLSDGEACLRDAALMQRLGVNAIRVYNINPDLNHDECASIFNIAGIYMLLDVNSPVPNESLSRELPWETYNHDYLNRTFAVVEAFKDYPNTAMFFSGNEVINDVPSSITAPYIRAVTRDLKQYIKAQSDRYIPVGYSAADVRDVLVDTWAYMQCSLTGDDTDDSMIDFFALNSYSWCGDATFSEAGYDQLVNFFNETSIPVFMSEYGCNEVRPRIFAEVAGLYSDKMTPYFSGGVVYEYTQEENEFGLVDVDADGSITLRTDYDNFQKQLNKLNLTELQSTKSLVPEGPFRKCSSKLIKTTKFPSNFTEIPSQPKDGTAELIKNGVKVAKNLNGKIIDIKDADLVVKQTVENSDQTAIKNLKVVRLEENKSNTPTGLTGGNGTASDDEGATKTDESKPAATSDDDSAAGMPQASGAALLVAALLTAFALI